MAWATIPYSKFPVPASDPFPNGQVIARPLLVVKLSCKNGSTFSCVAIVDSGADHCLFPASFANALGLDILKMKSNLVGGVGSSANTTYYDTIEIDFGAGGFEAYVGFTSGMDSHGVGLLGQVGFFDRFEIMMSHKTGQFHINLPDPPAPPAP